ncbi:hypothetical protein BKA93DRAFT_750173 [Sparassis latifolia]
MWFFERNAPRGVIQPEMRSNDCEGHYLKTWVDESCPMENNVKQNSLALTFGTQSTIAWYFPFLISSPDLAGNMLNEKLGPPPGYETPGSSHAMPKRETTESSKPGAFDKSTEPEASTALNTSTVPGKSPSHRRYYYVRRCVGECVYIASITESLDKHINAEDYGMETVLLSP